MRGKIQFEDIDLTQEQFYEILAEDAAVSTSQPSPGDLMDFWNKILEEYDDIVYIPMSSGLSTSCDTATVLSEDYEGKVQVVNNQRISVTSAAVCSGCKENGKPRRGSKRHQRI